MTNEDPLKLICVGDIAMGNHPKRPGFGFYSKYIKGLPFSFTKEIFPKNLSPDIVFGNLEFVLVPDASHPGSDTCCLGVSSFIPFLQQCGFTVLNVANNHASDYGKEVFTGTINLVKSFGIKVVGLAEDFSPENFLRVKNRKIALIGCTAHPAQREQAGNLFNVYNEGFIEKIYRVKKMADFLCISIHWGDEFIPIPSPEEMRIAHELIDAGVGLIIGHHPHVLREVERYKNGLIAYSLGNFIGDMTWNRITRETGCLFVETDCLQINNSKLFPATIGLDFFPKYDSALLEYQERLREKWKMDLKYASYEYLARKASKTNEWQTLGFFVRNLFRYKFNTILKIILHAIRARLYRNS